MNKNFLYYMIGQGSWFLSQGLQMVLFPTILVLMLNVSPAFYGLAQVSILAPSIFLIVLGGAIADRTDTRKLLGIIHLLATLPLFLILFGLNYSFLSFQIMILYGLTTGTAQAFALPARDSLLNKVANGNIQKTVITAMLIQFICQLSGVIAMGIVGICYMGNNLVALPYITTERYGLGSAGFAIVTSSFWAGTVFSNLVLIFNQQLKNWGKIMVFNLFFGTILIFLVFNIPFWLFCFLVFAWGSGAGVVISMSRTITQTFARETHRGRILSIYSLAIFSFGPLGALICGFIIENFGIANNVIISSLTAMTALSVLVLKTDIYKIKAPK